MGLLEDIISGNLGGDPDDSDERHVGRRGQPGEASKWELDQALNFRQGVKEGPKVDREQINIDAAEQVRAVVEEMTEDMHDVDNSNDHIDIVAAAGERFNDKSKESKQKNFPGIFPPKQTLPDLDDEEPQYSEVGQDFSESEPEEVDTPEEPQIDPSLQWGTVGLPQNTAADVQARLQALNEEDDGDAP
jgi:hypothetical protein